MKKHLLRFIMIIGLLPLDTFIYSQTAADSKTLTPVTLHRTDTIVMKARSNGNSYPVYIALPGSYYTSNREYPVIYMLDAYSSFGIVVQMARLLASDKEIPEMIIVGISSEGGSREFIYNRARDYTPSNVLPEKLSENARALTPVSGGAAKFLDFISGELIPAIESKYRAIPGDRTLAGHSYGGLFVFYTLFEKPELFKRYVMISPALFWDNELILKLEDEYYKSGKTLNAAVYTALGSLESPFFLESWNKLVSSINGRKYSGLVFTSSLIENETHYSMIPYIATRGLKSVFSSK